MNEIVFEKGLMACREKDWQAFEAAAYYDAETAVWLLSVCEAAIPKELKCRIAICHYAKDGDAASIIRKYVRQSRPYRPVNWREKLPCSVQNLNTFTIYRAGMESIDKVKNALSWTLMRDVAEWFAERHTHRHPEEKRHLYRATISADKVIAYIDGRQEFEIVQYRNAQNIEELPLCGVSNEFMDIHHQTMQGPRIYLPHCHPKELLFDRRFQADLS